MSKGSTRRPSAISREEWERRFSDTFPVKQEPSHAEGLDGILPDDEVIPDATHGEN